MKAMVAGDCISVSAQCYVGSLLGILDVGQSGLSVLAAGFTAALGRIAPLAGQLAHGAGPSALLAQTTGLLILNSWVVFCGWMPIAHCGWFSSGLAAPG